MSQVLGKQKLMSIEEAAQYTGGTPGQYSSGHFGDQWSPSSRPVKAHFGGRYALGKGTEKHESDRRET